LHSLRNHQDRHQFLQFRTFQNKAKRHDAISFKYCKHSDHHHDVCFLHAADVGGALIRHLWRSEVERWQPMYPKGDSYGRNTKFGWQPRVPSDNDRLALHQDSADSAPLLFDILLAELGFRRMLRCFPVLSLLEEKLPKQQSVRL